MLRNILIHLIPFIYANSICYQDDICHYGCFTSDYPFGNSVIRPLERLPQNPSDIDVKYYLDSKWSPSQRILPNEPESLRRSAFDPNYDTKIIIHGYVDTYNAQWERDISSKLIENDSGTNVIRIDWKDAGQNVDYSQSATDTQVVAAQIVCLIKQFYQHDLEKIATNLHCIGHSLGAQTCGYVGQYLNINSVNFIANSETWVPLNLARITGLDPAEPYFGYAPKEVALDETDAIFVDIIHSDTMHFRTHAISKHITPYGMGVVEPVGHVDFYPNNGTEHPGCDSKAVRMLGIEGLMDGTRDFVACNHCRSIKFFIESLNQNEKTKLQRCPFTAFNCNYQDLQYGTCLDCGINGQNCLHLGPDSIKTYNQFFPKNSKHNSFVLKTGGDLDNHDIDYCAHSIVNEIVISRDMEKDTKGQIFIQYFDASGLSTEFIPVTEQKDKLNPKVVFPHVPVTFNPEVVNLVQLKVYWNKEERTVTSRKLKLESISVLVGDTQRSIKFCNDEYPMKSGSKNVYDFYPCL